MSEESKTAQPDEEKPDVLITPEGEVLELGLTGTMKLNQDTEGKNANRVASVKFAIAGLLYVLTHEQSIKLATIATLVVVVIGLWLNLGIYSWALLTLALGAVWITECLNTAIEAAIDLETSDPQALAKIGKDVASTASLVSSIVFVIVVVLILLPPLLNKLSG